MRSPLETGDALCGVLSPGAVCSQGRYPQPTGWTDDSEQLRQGGERGHSFDASNLRLGAISKLPGRPTISQEKDKATLT